MSDHLTANQALADLIAAAQDDDRPKFWTALEQLEEITTSATGELPRVSGGTRVTDGVLYLQTSRPRPPKAPAWNK